MIRFILCLCLLLSLQAVSSSDCPWPTPAEFNLAQVIDTNYFHILNWKLNPVHNLLAYAGNGKQQVFDSNAQIQHWMFKQVIYNNQPAYIIRSRDTTGALYIKDGVLTVGDGLYATTNAKYPNQLWSVTQHMNYPNAFSIRSIGSPNAYLTPPVSNTVGLAWAVENSATNPIPSVSIQIAAPMIPDWSTSRITIARTDYPTLLMDESGNQISKSSNPGDKVLWNLIPTPDQGPNMYRLQSVRTGNCIGYLLSTGGFNPYECSGPYSWNQYFQLSADPQFNGLRYTVDVPYLFSLTSPSSTAVGGKFSFKSLTPNGLNQRYLITWV